MKQNKKISVEVECSACEGTGLYVGWTCHDGAAQVCRECGGTGFQTISYTPFTGRKKKEGIKKVFQYTPWRHLYPTDHTFDDGTFFFSRYGCTYEEWENGVTPKPIPESNS